MEASVNKKNLLIIDKDKQRCQEVCDIVSDIYSIIEIEDVHEAMSYLFENKYSVSVVLFGACNSSVEGIEFLNVTKKDALLSMIPVLLLAEEEETPAEAKMLTLGAIDCIHKPFHRETVRKRIANAIYIKNAISFDEIERVFNVLPSTIYLKDTEGRYIFSTHRRNHVDQSVDPNWTVRGKTDVDIRKDKENAAEAMKADNRIIASGQGTAYTFESYKDGEQKFYEVIKGPYKNAEGRIIGIVGLVNQVTEYEMMKRKLEKIVRTDELTGLYSRYYFEQYITNMLTEDMYPLSVISADCDGLKNINDTYGHLVGDEYIRMASLLFRMVIPEEGAAFRTGGDEFIIMLPCTPEETAKGYVEQMREKEQLFQIKGEKLSVSLGVSSMKSCMESVYDCIEASDRNMYREKRKKKRKR